MINITIYNNKKFTAKKDNGENVEGTLDPILYRQIEEAVSNIKTAKEIREGIIKDFFNEKPLDEILKNKEAAPEWSDGKKYYKGDKVLYQGDIYEIKDTHTASAFYPPLEAPGLYESLTLRKKKEDAKEKETPPEEKKPEETPEEIPVWEEPGTFSRGYNKGDKVKYMNRVWQSVINYNKNNPMDGGWVEVR